MTSSLDISGLKFETIDLSINSNKYWYAFILDFKLGRYFYFKSLIYRLKSVNKEIYDFLNVVNSFTTPVDDKLYKEVTDLLDALIDGHNKAKNSLSDINIFDDSQKKQLNDFFNDWVKRIVKVKVGFSKKYYKNKPKADDSELLKLIVNNNYLELQKSISK